MLLTSRLRRFRLTCVQCGLMITSVIGLALLTLPRAYLINLPESGDAPLIQQVVVEVVTQPSVTEYIISLTEPITKEAPGLLNRSASRLIEYHSTLPVTSKDINQTLRILDEDLVERKKAAKVPVFQVASYWNTVILQRQLLIVTSWRSGSTFLGEMLSSHPAVFQNYEPLVYAGANQIRSGDSAGEAVAHLTALFKCKFKNRKYLQQLTRKSKDLLSRNVQLWNTCLQSPNQLTCTDSTFLEQACARFPVILVKTVRLRLILTLPLLVDPQLRDLKIIFLVRDPRATFNSRYQLSDWCKSEDCADPSVHCNDMMADVYAFKMLAAQFPGRLKLIKYETLAANPHQTFQDLFRLADLELLQSVNETIARHTTAEVDNNGPWGTFRHSARRIDSWKQQLTRKQIQDVQTSCSQVMDKLGYPMI